MDVWIIRIVFIALLTYASYSLKPIKAIPYLNFLIGFALAIGIILFEIRIRKLSLKTLIGALIGSITGILGATLISLVLSRMTAIPESLSTFLQVFIIMFMAYVGLMLGAEKGNFLNMKIFEYLFTSERQGMVNYKILDTSVIIDGRIADICETGFIEGVLVVPQFILHELQMIADSSDSI